MIYGDFPFVLVFKHDNALNNTILIYWHNFFMSRVEGGFSACSICWYSICDLQINGVAKVQIWLLSSTKVPSQLPRDFWINQKAYYGFKGFVIWLRPTSSDSSLTDSQLTLSDTTMNFTSRLFHKLFPLLFPAHFAFICLGLNKPASQFLQEAVCD